MNKLLKWRGFRVELFAEIHPKIWGVGVHLSFEDDMFLVLVGPFSAGVDWS